MIVVGTTLGGATVGFVVGLWIGFREGGDFNIAPGIYAPFGGMCGAIAGMVLGVILS